MNWTDDKDEQQAEGPGEAQLRRDIRHFEQQISRLASPNTTWEQGALKCYRALVMQRREMLRELRSGELSSI